MPKALLWDFGNVLVRWNPRTLYAQVFLDPAECDRFLTEVCTMAWHLEHDRGATFADNRKPLLERFPQYEEQILAWERRWPEMFSGAIPETEAAILALDATGLPQFGLTNLSSEVIGHMKSLSPAFDRLKGIVVSGDEKLVKPDPAIFQVAIDRFGFDPAEVLFVDDSAPNIETARQMGFDTHHFEDPAALRPALEARGLL
ncbi:HAD family hydrolase [Phenylobacterium deserti]|uniref:HAD family phosphatase n=1 Tax=Phenylobacterium deserti TaxID=1914756 RepID=A0A328AQY5_9CAUL|nr:HAD family phosphatase [Phenylobacterium deserti]RAK56999.1 HAD family phosphatase [Phenylobacterium deserti]